MTSYADRRSIKARQLRVVMNSSPTKMDPPNQDDSNTNKSSNTDHPSASSSPLVSPAKSAMRQNRLRRHNRMRSQSPAVKPKPKSSDSHSNTNTNTNSNTNVNPQNSILGYKSPPAQSQAPAPAPAQASPTMNGKERAMRSRKKDKLLQRRFDLPSPVKKPNSATTNLAQNIAQNRDKVKKLQMLRQKLTQNQNQYSSQPYDDDINANQDTKSLDNTEDELERMFLKQHRGGPITKDPSNDDIDLSLEEHDHDIRKEQDDEEEVDNLGEMQSKFSLRKNNLSIRIDTNAKDDPLHNLISPLTQNTEFSPYNGLSSELPSTKAPPSTRSPFRRVVRPTKSDSDEEGYSHFHSELQTSPTYSPPHSPQQKAKTSPIKMGSLDRHPLGNSAYNSKHLSTTASNAGSQYAASNVSSTASSSFLPLPPHLAAAENLRRLAENQNSNTWKLKQQVEREAEIQQIRHEEEQKRLYMENQAAQKQMQHELEITKLKMEQNQMKLEEENRRQQEEDQKKRMRQEMELAKMKELQEKQQLELEQRQKEIKEQSETLEKEKEKLLKEAQKIRQTQEEQSQRFHSYNNHEFDEKDRIQVMKEEKQLKRELEVKMDRIKEQVQRMEKTIQSHSQSFETEKDVVPPQSSSPSRKQKESSSLEMKKSLDPKKQSQSYTPRSGKNNPNNSSHYRAESDEEDIFSGIGSDSDSESEAPTTRKKLAAAKKKAQSFSSRPKSTKHSSSKDPSHRRDLKSPRLAAASPRSQTDTKSNRKRNDHRRRNRQNKYEESPFSPFDESVDLTMQSSMQDAFGSFQEDASFSIQNDTTKDDASYSVSENKRQDQSFPSFDEQSMASSSVQNPPAPPQFSPPPKSSSNRRKAPKFTFSFPKSPIDTIPKRKSRMITPASTKSYKNEASLMDSVSPTDSSTQLESMEEDESDMEPPTLQLRKINPTLKELKEEVLSKSIQDLNIKDTLEEEDETNDGSTIDRDDHHNDKYQTVNEIDTKNILTENENEIEKNAETLQNEKSIESEEYETEDDDEETYLTEDNTYTSEDKRNINSFPSLAETISSLNKDSIMNSIFGQYSCTVLDSFTNKICRDPNNPSDVKCTDMGLREKSLCNVAKDHDGSDDDYSVDNSEDESMATDNDSWNNNKLEGDQNAAEGLSKQELQKWNAWDKQDQNSPQKAKKRPPGYPDFDDTASQLSRLTELETRQRKAQHLDRRARAHEQLLLSAYSALSIPQNPVQEEKPERGGATNSNKSSNDDKSVETTKYFMDGKGNLLLRIDETVLNTRDSDSVSSRLRAELIHFRARLKTEGLEVLKLNRDNKWQVRTFTVSVEEAVIQGDLNCPTGLLWVKKFVKDQNYSVQSIDKQGKGGMLFPQLVKAAQISKAKLPRLPAIAKKHKKEKYKNPVAVAINGFGAEVGSRVVVIQCMNAQDAAFLINGVNSFVKILRRNRKMTS